MGTTRLLTLLLLASGCAPSPHAGADAGAGDARAPRADRAGDEGADGRRAARELRDARRLVIDLGAMRACESLRGRILAIGDEGEAIRGRIWLRECEGRAERDQLSLRLGATVWTWADEDAQALGATFQVRQYVFLSADTTLHTEPRLEYDRACGYAYLWLRPVEDPEVHVQTIGSVDARPEGAWSHVFGAFARMIGQPPDDRARAQVDEEGGRRLDEVVDEGFTIYSDLCTSDVGMEMGHLSEPPHPRPARGEPGPRTRVELQANGLDVHGPISDGRQQMLVRVRTEGGPVRARLVCARDAERLMTAFSRGGPLPDVEAIAEGDAAPTTSLRGGRAHRCPLYLATVPLRDAPSTFSFTVQPVVDDRVSMVRGCGGACSAG